MLLKLIELIHVFVITIVKPNKLTKTRAAFQMAVKALNHWNNSIQITPSNLNKEKPINHTKDILNETKYSSDFFFKPGCLHTGTDKRCFAGTIQVDSTERKNIDGAWYIICY